MSERLPFLHFGNGVLKHYRGMAGDLGIERAGWIHYPREAQALYDLADVAPGPIVEIGTYLGYSTAFLSMPGRWHVTTIDPHVNETRDTGLQANAQEIDTAKECKRAWRALGLDGRITQWVKTSEAAATEATAPAEVGLVFIDGDHSPGAVARDIELWAPRVMVGGYVALHDWGVRGEDAEAWDVAGCCAAYFDRERWFGPVLCGTVAWYRREA